MGVEFVKHSASSNKKLLWLRYGRSEVTRKSPRKHEHCDSSHVPRSVGKQAVSAHFTTDGVAAAANDMMPHVGGDTKGDCNENIVVQQCK